MSCVCIESIALHYRDSTLHQSWSVLDMHASEVLPCDIYVLRKTLGMIMCCSELKVLLNELVGGNELYLDAHVG